ncbi:MAG: hypothetical protein V4555_15605 [Acidobacteriota bacterium]
MRRKEIFALGLSLIVVGALVPLVLYGDRHIGEDGHMAIYLVLVVFALVGNIWTLVNWIRFWRKMTPEERLAYKESRRWWKRRT